ncbi:signal peptidase I [Fructobacillus papyrifericola]|uniref:Signal peptidase I n=1 Tax=Fructobacillus papyrifericola TaxID=2713172 RepID=A0ABS5QUD2_9LACO|nr:signal peptidase I [Fructobacillus papyrifericola]MBS9336716.1 signal peptidase I [Fructobacillus papyrifericola]
MKKLFLFIWNWVVPIAIGILAYLAITTFWVNVVTINGDSMDPNLLDQQKVVVQKTQNLKRGDVVVFDARQEDPRIKAGNKDYVKRVIAVAGDTVEYKDGTLYVNNKKVDESYISTEEQNAGTASSFGSSWSLKTLSSTGLWEKSDQNKSVVPKDSYFVLGDHRSVSNDSRYFGFVSKKHVIGKIHVPFWYSTTVKNNISKQDQHYFA